jgi:AraC-like DNA-binding protein
VVQAIERDPFLTADRLARGLYLSPSRLAHRFRSLAGFPPGAYALAVRMQEAKRLLASTGQPVVHVAMEVGYDSLGTFTSRFGQLVGASPGRFRARLDEEGGPDLTALVAEVADATVEGRLEAPAGFAGVAYVGLFASYLPAGRPAAGIVAAVPGTYRLPRATPGWYRVLAAAFPAEPTLRELLLGHATLVATGARAVRVAENETVRCDLRFAPPAPGDPPVVVALGLLRPRRLTQHPL